MTRHRRQAPGFTLIEVTVALAIGGMTVAGAAAILYGMVDRAAAIRAAAARVDRAANGERLLRALLANLDLSGDGGPAVKGDARAVDLRSWCEDAAGWLKRCVVRVAVDSAVGVLRVGSLEVRRGLRRGGLRYLLHARQGGAWVDRWSELVPPAAIGVILDDDTLLVAVWGVR